MEGNKKSIRPLWKRRCQQKKLVLFAIPLTFLLVALFSSFDLSAYEEEIHRGIRILKKSCKLNTPYVRVQDVIGWMPHVATPAERGTPSHIALCEGYLDRVDNPDDVVNGKQRIKIVENSAFCTDWSAPHFSIMSIYASSLIATVGKKLGLEYQHGCHRTIGSYRFERDNNGQMEMVTTHWDFTTAQQLLVENLVSSVDAKSVDESIMKQLCSGCIAFHEQQTTLPASYSTASHQCMLFPGAVEQNSQVALRSVLPSVLDRLRKGSQDWLGYTDPIPGEHETGVIVYLDDTSTLLHYSVYDENIPSAVTSIQIFLSSSCARASARGQSSCVEHGRRIKRYFIQTRGVVMQTYVRIDVVAATAASFSRMVAVKTLICPPGSVSCLLPAVAKNPGTSAIIVDAMSRPATHAWFEHLKGLNQVEQSVSVVNVAADQLSMPKEVIGERAKNPNQAASTDETPREEKENKEAQMMHEYAQENLHEYAETDDTEVTTLPEPAALSADQIEEMAKSQTDVTEDNAVSDVTEDNVQTDNKVVCPNIEKEGTMCVKIHAPVVCEFDVLQCQYSNRCVAESMIGIESSKCIDGVITDTTSRETDTDSQGEYADFIFQNGRNTENDADIEVGEIGK